MDESLDEEVARRVRELRGWVSKGTRPRRTIYLAAALYERIKDDDPARFPEAIGLLAQFLRGYSRSAAAAAIFDGKDVTDDPRYQRKRPLFGGGWERIEW
jgi:hypothetical protein